MEKTQSNTDSFQNYRKNLVSVSLLILSVLLITLIWGGLSDRSRAESSEKIAQSDVLSDAQKLIGQWLRPDGGYVIEIRKIHVDGKVDAAYFNPRQINVETASVSKVEDLTELFIRLRDQGYPGSTYKLKYDVANDLLVGVYFQASMRQSYNVIFQRKE